MHGGGPIRDAWARLRDRSVSLVGGAMVVAALGYAVTLGPALPVVALEIVVPVWIGSLVVWVDRTAPVERRGVVAAAAVLGAVGLAGTAFWTLSVASSRVAPGDAALVALTAASVGAGVGVGVGRLYTALAAERREVVRLTRAIEGSMDGVAIVDEDRHVYANDAYANLFGYGSPEAVVGRRWDTILTPEAGRTVQTDVRPALAERRCWRGTLTAARRDGTTVPVEASVSAGDGGIVAVVRDVSGRTEREQRIQVLSRVLRHNLRNAFTVIRGHANLLAERAPDLAADHVDPIRAEIEDLLATADKARGIERTLDGSRERGTTDPSDAVRSVVDRATAAYPDAAVFSQVEESGLRPVDATVTDALDELVDNAVEHADCPEPTIEISVRSVDDGSGGRIEFTVADDGPGIPESDRRAVVEGEETPLTHGSGLGLWLVNWIATSAGGDVRFADTADGSAVVLSFQDDWAQSADADATTTAAPSSPSVGES